ncbi:P-loop containing nucleoside triphosphate hydrolase protein [Haematococcus lacustris]
MAQTKTAEKAATQHPPPNLLKGVMAAKEQRLQPNNKNQNHVQQEQQLQPGKHKAREQQQQQGRSTKSQQQEESDGEKGNCQAAARAGPTGGRGAFFAHTPDGTSFRAASFSDLSLGRPLLRACEALGYSQPTPIQAAVIPLALAGRDICGSAITGSGKTAAFALPCLERLLHRPRQVAATYVLMLTPTRELAVQIHSMVTKLAQHTDISVALIVGGLSVAVQTAVLRRSPEVIVATPGRLIDHLRNTQSVGLEDLAVLVLDEADRLLEMGFQDEITEIVRMAPKKRQTMLFSATFNDEVKRLVSLSLKQPVRLAADAAAAVPKDLRQEIVRLKGPAAAGQKEAQLLALCARSFRGGRTIVFFRTKQRAHRAKILFGLLGLPLAAELHGDMTQAARLESLEAFRTATASFLLATDVAARGLDIQGVQVVINYDAARKLDAHLHRIGRTARAGASGIAVTFVEDGDRGLIKEVVKRTKADVQQRVVPPAAVAQWQAKVEGAEADLARVIQEERYEREMRRAEMEANKMQNMLDHEAEIQGRPARTWFQTERQKRDVRSASGRQEEGVDVGSDDGDGRKGLDARGKHGAKQEAKNKKREKRKVEAAEAGGPGAKRQRRDALQQETEEFSKAIRTTKSKLRSLKEQGIPANKAAKIAAAAASGHSSKKPARKKPSHSGKASLQADGSTLFSGDGTGKSGSPSVPPKDNKVSVKGAYLRDRSGLDKTALARLKRGGSGKHSFKSKSKYKRK